MSSVGQSVCASTGENIINNNVTSNDDIALLPQSSTMKKSNPGKGGGVSIADLKKNPALAKLIILAAKNAKAKANSK
jgi:hypothetical protein